MDNAGVELDIERTPSNQGGSTKPESTPSTETNESDTGNKTSEPICASVSVDPNDKNDAETKALRIMLKLYFYAAFKWKDNRCSFHIIYCIIFMMQIVKVLLITDQMFRFGQARSNFSSQVNRGHLTLKHLLLKDWSASWETLPYPPSHGDFALYTIDDLESGINFAVTRYYNAEHEATGYYVRTGDDNMTVFIKYFDFPDFGDTNGDEVQINDTTFSTDAGLSKTINGNNTLYSYNITEALTLNNVSHTIKRMLSTTLQFSLHSVRIHANSGLATCLQVKGEVIYTDFDHNGQVGVDLNTLAKRIKCEEMNFTMKDWQLEDDSLVGRAVIALCTMSILVTIFVGAFAGYVFWKTKQFMKRKKEDLPAAEYFRFLKLWDILVFLSDTMTISGTRFVISDTKETEWILETFDSYTVWLGIGCVFAWLSLLRFFKFNIKFHLLFSTLYRAFFDVMAYLLCVIVLFIGFWVCGYVVLGPYHVKFRTPETAAEALFAIVNGDEIYATLAILENEKSRSNWVFWFSRFYIWTYVAIFTVVVYNLLIALFMNAYDSIKDYYAEKQDDRNLSPMEKALRRYLTDREEMKNKSSASTNNNLSKNLYDFLTGTDEASDLRHEMLKLVKVREQEKDVVFVKPRTLKAFMEAEEDQIKYFNCCCFEVSFVLFKSKDVMQA